MSRQVDEETPLLSGKSFETASTTTTLPFSDFLVLLIFQLAEPVTCHILTPFLPQLIRDIGITQGNEARVGYYVGLMQSLFFIAEAMTVLHWSKISDHVGRKPVLLVGLFGLSMSMYCFGLSKTFVGLVMSRMLNGALNGNVGVMKSMMMEMSSDPKILAKAYSTLPIAWATGSSLGPLIGGISARPVEQFPAIFGNSKFLQTYPYFLPCAIAATFTFLVWLVVLFFLRETLEYRVSIGEYLGFKKGKLTSERSSETDVLHWTIPESERPISVRQLLRTRRVVVAGGSFATFCFLDIMFRSIQPVFYSTPVAFGGLGLHASSIGNILSLLGIIGGIVQGCFFAKIHAYLGSRKTFLVGLMSLLPMWICLPIMSVLVKHQGRSALVWGLVVIQSVSCLGENLAFGAAFVYVASSSPNNASLGTTNGVNQMAVSIMRALGPAAASSLFSVSMEKGYMGGFLVYYFQIALVFVGIWVASHLPNRPWSR